MEIQNLLKKIFYLVILILPYLTVKGQDMQYSQYYNTPLYLNPAFAGTAENTRAIFNYRNQWPGLGNPFVAYSFSFDHQIEPIKSGVGLLFNHDRQGTGKFASTSVGAIYSYTVPLNDEWVFKPGLQASFVTRSVDYNRFTFGDQIDNNGNVDPGSFEANGQKGYSYIDFSTGGLLYNKNFWIGLSANHLNKPNQSFYNSPDVSLPVKTSIHSGLRIPVKEVRGKSKESLYLIPTLNYKHQGKTDQLDLGLYAHYNNYLMLGLWYRGIPIKKLVLPNTESIIVFAGLRYEDFSFGYSYDITISKLAWTNTHGAHEISLLYEWEVPYRKKKKIMKKLPCPKFDR